MSFSTQRMVKAGLLVTALLVAVLALGACGESIDSRMSRASADLEAGEYRSAEIQLKNVLQKEPDNARAQLLLGRLSLATAQYEDAIVQLQRASELGVAEQTIKRPLARALLGAQRYGEILSMLPDQPSGDAAARAAQYSLRGDAMVGLERYDAAEKQYAKALSLVPGFPRARVGQADIAERRGDSAKAARLLTQVLKTHPDNPAALKAQGALAYNEGRCGDARPYFERIMELGPTAVPQIQRFMARAFLADCQLRLQQYDNAEENIAVLMKQGPQNPYANYLQALVSVRHQDYEQATIHLQRLLKASPRNTRGLLLMASVKIEEGEDELAESYLNDALTYAPSNRTALRMLASLYIRQGHPEEAVERLRGVLALSPDDMELRAMLAEALVSAGDSHSALKYALADANKQLDAGASWPIGLATRMVQAGDDEAATALLDEIDLSGASDDIKTSVLRIVLLLRKNDVQAALSHARALVDDQPGNATRLRLLASTYLATGRVEDARATLERGLAEADAGPEFRLALGLLSLRAGDYDKARAELEAVLDTEPNHLGAQIALAKLSSVQGDSAAAIDWLKAAQESHPDDDRIDVALARAYLDADVPDKALTLIKPLIERHPKNGVLSHLHGTALIAADRTDAGIEALAQAAQTLPDRPGFRLDLAHAQMAAGRIDAARQELTTLRQQFPKFLPAASTLAQLQLQQGETDAALATAEGFTENADSSVASDMLKGNILAAQEHFAAAADAYESAFAQQPTRELALKLFEARRRAEQSEAGKVLERWLAKHPEDVAVRLRWAEWLQADGRYADATAAYEAVLAMDDGNVAALNNLALLYAQQGDPRALEFAERAYARASDNPAVADTLGWLVFNAGQHERGLSLIREAAAAESSVPEIQYHLAAALAKSSSSADRAEAQKILEHLLAADSGFEQRAEAKKIAEQLDDSSREQIDG